MDVDEDEEDGDQQGHPARDDLGVHQKAETIATMKRMVMEFVIIIIMMRMRKIKVILLGGIWK